MLFQEGLAEVVNMNTKDYQRTIRTHPTIIVCAWVMGLLGAVPFGSLAGLDASLADVTKILFGVFPFLWNTHLQQS